MLLPTRARLMARLPRGIWQHDGYNHIQPQRCYCCYSRLCDPRGRVIIVSDRIHYARTLLLSRTHFATHALHTRSVHALSCTHARLYALCSRPRVSIKASDGVPSSSSTDECISTYKYTCMCVHVHGTACACTYSTLELSQGTS